MYIALKTIESVADLLYRFGFFATELVYTTVQDGSTILARKQV